MTISRQTLQSRLDTLQTIFGTKKFTREQAYNKLKPVPLGTVSANLSKGAKAGLIQFLPTRPRQYYFMPQALIEIKEKHQTDNIDSLLDIVAEIESRGLRKSTIAPLLIWIAEALLAESK